MLNFGWPVHCKSKIVKFDLSLVAKILIFQLVNFDYFLVKKDYLNRMGPLGIKSLCGWVSGTPAEGTIHSVGYFSYKKKISTQEWVSKNTV